MSITLLESGSHLLLEDGTSSLLEDGSSSAFFVLLESGSHLLLEVGTSGFLLEDVVIVGFSDYPDPFGAQLLPSTDLFNNADQFKAQRIVNTGFAGADAQKVQLL